MMTEQNMIQALKAKPIRKIWHDEAWYFSIIDIIELLTESANAQSYWG